MGLSPLVLIHFPRIRGDDPSERTIMKDFHYIFPVFAGMIPRNHGVKWPWPHFPRIRGDDPGAIARARDAVVFSPYSRG